MRPLSLPAGWFLLCCLAAIASRVAGQEIRFAEGVHDFGQARRGEFVNYDFIFTNTGDSLLLVSNVQPACGCTTAGDWTKSVAPGKTGLIPVRLNTRQVSGIANVFIRVTSNDPHQPAVDLRLHGKISNTIYADPPYARFDLSPNPGDNTLKVLEITNDTGQPVSLSLPVCNETNFTAGLQTIQPGWEYHLQVRLVSPPGPGQPQGLITIQTSSTDQPVLVISALIVRPGSGDANPALGFPAGQGGTNSAATWLTSAAISRLEHNHLQWLDDPQAVALFQDPRYHQHRIVFVDARNDRDYQSGHIPGACQFDPYHPEKYQAALPLCRAAEQVVVYCHGPDCEDSDFAAISLREAGVATQNLFVYAGGMNRWSALQLPIEK